MKRALALCCLVGAYFLPSEADARAPDLETPDGVLNLDGVWLFQQGDNPIFARAGLDDLSWEQRPVPTRGTPWAFRWHGSGWYRLHLTVRPEAVGYDLMLTLGPVREAAEVYINGALVGERGRFGTRPAGGSRILPLTAPIPAGVLHTGDNVIAVRLLDPSWDGGVTDGPILLGPAELVRQRLGGRYRLGLAVRIGLALLAIFLAAAQLVGQRRRTAREAWWMAGAGFGLALWHLGGTGTLTSLLPNLELAARLPAVAGPFAVLCLGSFFASRYGDDRANHVAIGQAVLAVVTGALLLGPDALVYWVAEPALLLSALITTLYAAYLSLRAARRQERDALPVFTSVLALALLIIYDGLLASGNDVWPPPSTVGAVGVLLVTSLLSTRQAAIDRHKLLDRIGRLERRLDDGLRISMLDASVISLSNMREFLQAVVHETGRRLQVRRCSLALAEADCLHVVASVGLPRHAANATIAKEGSIAGWVFTHAQPLTDAVLPPELASSRRSGHYLTDAFVSYPICSAGRVLGVLSVSDRNDAGPFNAEDEAALADIAEKLALVLTRSRAASAPAALPVAPAAS